MEALTIWAGKKALTTAWKGVIADKVVARWSNYRATIFTETLVDALRRDQQDQDTSELDEALQGILKTEWKSEAVFEAYRRVSLARSRDIGPCIIALLTAELLIVDGYPRRVGR